MKPRHPRHNMFFAIARGAGMVALGTAAGQAVLLAATPWLARQHTPADFGALALLITVSNIATAVACARFDLAIPGSSDDDAPRLLRVALAATTASAIGVFAVLAVGHLSGADWPSPFNGTVLVAVCVLFAGIQQATLGEFTRLRRYGSVGAVRCSQSGMFALLASVPGVGLLMAHVVSLAVSLPSVHRHLARKSASLQEIRRSAIERRDFPLLSLPGALLDVIGYSACVWIVVHYFGTDEAGQYSQIQRVIGAPMMLLSMSTAQVLLRANVDALGNGSTLSTLLRRLGLFSGALGLTLVAAVAVFGEPVLRSLLGPQWRVDAAFVVPITVAVAVRACVSPLSTLLITLRRFDLALRWQALYFASSIVVLASAAAHLELHHFVLVYAAHELLLYGLYLLLIAKAVRTLPCAASSA